jgi:hypothetical protein
VSVEAVGERIVSQMREAVNEMLALAPGHEDMTAVLSAAKALIKASDTVEKYLS